MSHADLTILYVITDLELGGVPLHLYRLVAALRERGYRASVVSLASVGPVGRMMRETGIEVDACEGCCGGDVRVLVRLARIIKQRRPGIVHSLLFHANLAVRLVGLEIGFPAARIVGEIQTVEVERPWHLFVERWTHRLCRCIVGNSPSVVDHLASRGRIPRAALRLIRGGIDPAPLRAARPLDRTTLGLSASSPMVLWVGRFDPVKGLDTLVEAFADVARKTHAHLVLAGDGPLRSFVVDTVRRCALTNRVHLLGARHDVPALMKTADVFALPSRTEGLPNALLEAMAVGCAIVTTDVPGCRDLVEDGRTGLLVPYGDTSALSTAILHVLGDPAVARRLGQNAREHVERCWPIERTHAAYADLYRRIAADSSL